MTAPGIPDRSLTASDLMRAYGKQFAIGADIAASVLRRCGSKAEAVGALHMAMTIVCGQFKSEGKSPEGNKK